MNVSALIVEWQTPDLLDLCLASLMKFAPSVHREVVTGGPGAHYHAQRILEYQRQFRYGGNLPDVVILLDSDVVVTSSYWLDAMTSPIKDGHALAVGGIRSRGDVSQVFIGERLMLHASCLAIAGNWFMAQLSFASEFDEVTQYVQLDTAHGVTLGLSPEHVHTYPFYRVGHGPLFPGLQCGEYYSPEYDREIGRHSLWAHLWRGTSAQPRGPVHRLVRRLKSRLGSPHAKTLLAHEARRAAFIKRGWEIVNSGEGKPLC